MLVSRFRSRRRFLSAALIGTGAVLAAVGVVVLMIKGFTLEVADQAASVISLTIGLASLILGLHARKTEKPFDNEPSVALTRASSLLAERVRRQWEDEAGMRGLHDHPLVTVRWSTTTRPVAVPPKAVVGENAAVAGRVTRLRLAGDLGSIVRTVHDLPARRLLVLGEPGSGKTVLAIHFTLAELERRQATEPVPVLLQIADWDPQTEHLHVWLGRRIAEEYPMVSGLADELVRSALILPVLDGLDEMRASSIPGAVSGLNAAGGAAGLVVTCRSATFSHMIDIDGERLARAAAVEIEPVDGQCALDYLTEGDEGEKARWREVADQLEATPTGNLARTLSTPFMLSIARQVYAASGTDPAQLAQLAQKSSPEAIGQELMRLFVPAVYSDIRPVAPGAPRRVRTQPQQAEAWLSLLARHQEYRLGGTPDLAWWKLASAVPARVVGAVAGLAAALCCGGVLAAVTMLYAFPVETSVLLFPVLLVGLTVGLNTWRSARALLRPRTPHSVRTQLAQSLRDVLLAALLTTPLLMLMGAGFSWNVLPFASLVWICASALSGVAGGLRADGAVTPRRVSVRLRGLGRILLGRLLTGLIAGVVTGIPVLALWGLPFGIVSARFSGVLIALASAGAVGVAAIGLPLALGRWVAENANEETAVTPASLLRSDRAAFVVAGLVNGTALALPIVIVVVLLDPERPFVVAAISVSAALATFGVVSACSAAPAQVCFLAAHAVLAAQKKLPWRLMRFLADARQREVLRQAGSVYQFRHALLSGYLAGPPPDLVRRTFSWRALRPRGPILHIARQLATALPVAILLTATISGSVNTWDALKSEMAETLMASADEIVWTDPIAKTRMRHASLQFDASPPFGRPDMLTGLLAKTGAFKLVPAPPSPVLLTMSQDGRNLATTMEDGTVMLSRLNMRGDVVANEQLPAALATTVKFSADGRTLASLHRDHTMHFWRLPLYGLPNQITAVEVAKDAYDFGFDGPVLVTVNPSGQVQRRNWRTPWAAKVITPAPNNPPTGNRRIFLNDTGAIAFGWLSEGEEIVTWRTDTRVAEPVLMPGSQGQRVVNVSTRESNLIAAGPGMTIYDRTARGTPIATGEIFQDIDDIAMSGGRVAILAHGQILVSSVDQIRSTVTDFTVDSEAFICKYLERSLTRDELRRHVPDSPLAGLIYKPVC